MLLRKTIDNKGTKTVWVKCAGKEKEQVSVMLLDSSSGYKKKLCIVFKQQAPTTAEDLETNRSQCNGYGQVHAISKVWFTASIVVKWFKYNYAFNTKPLLFLLTGQNTSDVNDAAKQLNITKMTIPPGLTGVAQPANISWNKPKGLSVASGRRS